MVADSEKENHINVLNAIFNRAIIRIVNDFFSKSGINGKLKIYGNSYCNGRYDIPFEEVPAATDSIEQGILFTFPLSKYLSLRIDELVFYSPSSANITFFIKDNISGTVLKEVNVVTEVGKNLIKLNTLVFPAPHRQHIFVGYDGSSTGYYKTTNLECYEGCDCDCEILSCTGCTYVRGLIQDTKTHETFGLSVSYALECSMERLICENKNLFSRALLYASGIEYLHEVMGSDRINYFTSTNAEEREKLMDSFTKSYWAGLTTAIKNINFCDDCCFECQEPISYRYTNF